MGGLAHFPLGFDFFGRFLEYTNLLSGQHLTGGFEE